MSPSGYQVRWLRSHHPTPVVGTHARWQEGTITTASEYVGTFPGTEEMFIIIMTKTLQSSALCPNEVAEKFPFLQDWKMDKKEPFRNITRFT